MNMLIRNLHPHDLPTLDKHFGTTQRLYARIGYIPDNGITYHHECVVPGDNYCVDDDLLLWLRKSIAQN